MHENPYQTPATRMLKENLTSEEKRKKREWFITKLFLAFGASMFSICLAVEGCQIYKENQYHQKRKEVNARNKEDMEQFLEKADAKIPLEEIADKFQEIDRKNTKEVFSKN
jgi:activator of 2-hydroxyglutaryl-CoA dehydratase